MTCTTRLYNRNGSWCCSANVHAFHLKCLASNFEWIDGQVAPVNAGDSETRVWGIPSLSLTRCRAVCAWEFQSGVNRSNTRPSLGQAIVRSVQICKAKWTLDYSVVKSGFDPRDLFGVKWTSVASPFQFVRNCRLLLRLIRLWIWVATFDLNACMSTLLCNLYTASRVEQKWRWGKCKKNRKHCVRFFKGHSSCQVFHISCRGHRLPNAFYIRDLDTTVSSIPKSGLLEKCHCKLLTRLLRAESDDDGDGVFRTSCDLVSDALIGEHC